MSGQCLAPVRLGKRAPDPIRGLVESGRLTKRAGERHLPRPFARAAAGQELTLGGVGREGVQPPDARGREAKSTPCPAAGAAGAGAQRRSRLTPPSGKMFKRAWVASPA